MTDSVIGLLLLASHLMLFAVKLWAVIVLLENFNKYKFLSILTSVYLLIQVWFTYCFFLDIDLYYYEIVSIVDQIALTVIVVLYLTKEECKWLREEVTAEK